MGLDAALALLARAEQGDKWPLLTERPLLTRINTWAALLDGDSEKLKRIAGITGRSRYRVDPLPERISETWAHYLFGDEAKVSVPDTQGSDNDLYQALVAANDLPSELERAAVMCSAEGEIWPRIYVDELVAPYPLVEWVSRANIFPLWVGKRLAAAAVVTELERPRAAAKGTVYRHLEVHSPGYVLNVLYEGKAETLGVRVDLTRHPATDGLIEVWEHGLPGMLLGRIPNKIRKDPCVGVSDYAGIFDYLLDLNDIADTGAYNVRLTARKRAVVSANALKAVVGGNDLGDSDLSNGPNIGGRMPPVPVWDPREQVFVEDPLDDELGRGKTDPFRVVEYSFDAQPLITWKRDVVETALSRVGLTGQYVGTESAGEAGYAISGTALRLRLIPTDKTGRGKARYWQSAMPRILSTMAQVDALPVASLGLGRPWADPTALPTFTRAPGLPVDEVEEAGRHATLLGAGAESVETAVRELHPDWSEQQVSDEVDVIREDRAAAPGSMAAFGAGV